MNPELKLYSYRRCPFAIRVRMTLHEKGIPFVTIEEDLKNLSPELRKLHPEAKVPLLVHGDCVVYESAIITEYLEDWFPSPALMPFTAHDRAKVRLWTHWCNQHFKPHIDHFKYGTSRSTPDLVEQAPKHLNADLTKLESRLEHHTWLVGEHFGLADIHVFPFYRQLSITTPPLTTIDDFPKTKAWFEQICLRNAFEKTMHKE
ncbi:MAG: glutathione S-transferase family protein [Bdellovibrionales bacterium]|nr:glutathione S-transferase family protein [Bdellovibrionales bacterium]